MSTVGELIVRMSGSNAALKAALLESGTASEAFAARAEVAGARSSSALRGVGVVAAGLAAGVVAFGAEAAHQAASFQSSMELIRTQAGGTQAEVEAMSGAVLALAPVVGTGPEALAAALYHVESAGLRGAQALEVLKIAAEGAKVGHANLESVTNALVGTVNSGVKGISSMAGAMGTLNAIVGAGNMRMDDLSEAMGTGILTVAKSFGVSIQSVGASIATMTNQNIPATLAATALRSAIMLMGGPTAAAAKAFKSVGLSTLQLAADMRSPGGMLTAVQDLKSHMDAAGIGGKEAAAFIENAFGKKQSTGILTLLGSIDKLKTAQDQVAKGAGSFGDAWAATSAEADQAGAEIQASLSTITTSVGGGLLPAVSRVLGVITPVIQGIAQWAAANQPLAATILVVTGGISLLTAAVIFLQSSMAATIAGALVVVAAIAAVIGVVVGLAAHFGLLGTGAKNAVDGIAGKAVEMGRAFVAWVGPMIPKAIAALGAFAQRAIDWLAAQIPVLMAQLGKWAQAFIDWIGPMIPPALAALGDLASRVFSWIAEQVPIWAAQLAAWAGQFVDWAANAIPPLLGALGDLGSQLIAWIAAEAPVLMAQVLVWVQSFLAWIAPLVQQLIAKIPDILAALARLGVAVVGWIASQVPVIAGALAKVALEFVSWVIPKIPELIGALAQFGVALIGWIVGRVPVIAGQLIAWSEAFFEWVGKSIAGLLPALAGWLASLLSWIAGVPAQVAAGAYNIGRAIFDGILKGIGDIGKAVGDKLNQIPGVSIVGGVVSFGGSVVSNTIGGVGQLGSNIAGGIGNLVGTGGSGPTTNQNGTKNLQQFALGGVVPGSGPVLAIVHGGERIIPAGAAGGSSRGGSAGGGVMELHTHLHIGDREVGEVVDRFLYNALGIHQQQAPATGSAR